MSIQATRDNEAENEPLNERLLPAFYRQSMPIEQGRANIELSCELSYREADVKLNATVPAERVAGAAVLSAGVLAGISPVLVVAIACNADLPVWATVSITGTVTLVILGAFTLIAYLIHSGARSERN